VHNRASYKKTIDGVDPINSSTLSVIGVASLHRPVAVEVPPMLKLNSDHVQRTDTSLKHMHEVH